MRKLLDFLFPRRCPVCDGILSNSEGLVHKECEKECRPIEEPICKKCGKPVETEEQEYCLDCVKKTVIYERGLALWLYNGKIKESIYRFKYQNKKEYCEFYAAQLAEAFGNRIIGWKPDALLPVPIHKKKRKKRGYNQAELLAKLLGKHLDIPVVCNYVIRTINTAPQKNLNSKERQNNLKKAFKISSNDVKLKRVVIIDDIYTTGSTVNAISKILRDADVQKIYFISLTIGIGR